MARGHVRRQAGWGGLWLPSTRGPCECFAGDVLDVLVVELGNGNEDMIEILRDQDASAGGEVLVNHSAQYHRQETKDEEEEGQQ